MAVKARVTDVVAEIKQISTSTVSKFISLKTTKSELSTDIETFLAHPKVSKAVQDGFGTLTYGDLQLFNIFIKSIDQELQNILKPLLNKGAVQRLYVFTYLTILLINKTLITAIVYSKLAHKPRSYL